MTYKNIIDSDGNVKSNHIFLKISIGLLIIILIVGYFFGIHMYGQHVSKQVAHQEKIEAEYKIKEHPMMQGYAHSADAHGFINKLYQLDESQKPSDRITPSLLIGQAALESDWGQSALYKNANNPFGVKGSYHGHTINYDTEENVQVKKKSRFVNTTAQFKKYPNLRVAVRDHNRLLKNKFLDNPHDTYVNEAKELQQNGYATDPHYAVKLMQYIESNNLVRFD